MQKSSAYFNKLNYSLANEDTHLEFQLSLQYKAQNIVSVCGSGSRAIPLITPYTKKLTIVDLSLAQIDLAKLRIATYLQFAYENFIHFWDYPSPNRISSEERKKLFHTLNLEQNTLKYFTEVFENNNWNTILYDGKWEKTFILFSKIVQKTLGKKNVDKLFSFKNLSEQVTFLESEFPMLRWKLLIILIGNKTLFNALLYKGHFISKNIPGSYFEYYFKAFNHLFHQDLCRKSFFLQLCFLGKINFSEGILLEAHQERFYDIQKNLRQVEIIFAQTDILSAIKKEKNLDFISFSDVPCYFSGEVEKNFLQECIPSLATGAHIILRNYLRIPNAVRTNFINKNLQHQDLIKNETVQMYNIEILRYEKSTNTQS